MANQPTKYRKFVVGAASAALVASAVAPVASAATFSDVSEGNSHKASIDALVAKGVISGYPDGTFKPTQTLKRSDVVKMMGKWLKSEGYTVAADYKTNPRFADLTSSSNEELLEMAALVKDNGLFVGTPDGKLDPNGNITRENMAIVIVRAFDTVHNIDLATYVAGQEFKKDVVDLAKAKAEARPAIDVLDYFDITNPAAPSFNPKDTTNRAQFASFLNKAIETDYSEVTSGVVGDVAVKAVNATTVEVTFKDAVENVNSLNFTIEGLTVSNAAVKQTDNKTVVLTTAVQEGGKEYTVALNNDKIGTFKGVSAVVPTKIDITTQSVQGKTGQQAIISADVGVKQAGIPVTFNVDALSTSLNKDQVFEAVTNADGIATFSYTQYAAGTDEVVAYPTGAPTVRSHAFVFWGVDTILSLTSTDDKGNSVKNGEDKTYKLTYLDPKTGKPVANKKFNVTFAENVDVNIDKTSKATVNGVNPTQLLNNTAPVVATVTTDSKGEAIFTVSGHNTAVTPVVFEDIGVESTKYEANKLQATVDKLTFGALQSDYVIDVTRAEGGEEAAIGLQNGREYKVVVKTKDGKAAANELVNVAFNEDLDRSINTNTEAYFVDEDGNAIADPRTKSYTVKTDSKGEASFTIASGLDKDYATPIVWIDINSADARDGKFDEGEPYKLAPITYFAQERLSGGVLTPSNTPGGKKQEKFAGTETAYFSFTASNQSGKAYTLDSRYKSIDATFTITNTGSNDITVIDAEGKTQVVSPNRPHTVHIKGDKAPYIAVKTGNETKTDLTTSVSVTATGTAQPTDSTKDRTINLGSHTKKVEFTSTTDVGVSYTGLVETISTSGLKFVGKSEEKFASSTKFYGGNGSEIFTAQKFMDEVFSYGTGVYVTFIQDADGVKTFKIVRGDGNTATKPVNKNLVDAKKALKDSIDAVVVNNYVTADQAAAQNAVNAANTAYNNGATVADFTNAKTALQNALNALELKLAPAYTVTPDAAGNVTGTSSDTLTFTFNAVDGSNVTIAGFDFDTTNLVVGSTTSNNRAQVTNGTARQLVLTVNDGGFGSNALPVDLTANKGDKFVFDANVKSNTQQNAVVTVTVSHNGTDWVATVVQK
ncbi:S-layer homology domain-containing protein [Sporosarcina koreensis]|uniref:S-layer homology domain-containing protein n=1 Tax=Sporosarcina koreensis TaxID=334735 RepID=UPI00075D8228|nr:S-layer homology domain-containing protein [Sporosarcina koreensis]